MFDLFDTGPKIDKKWSISNFISTSYKNVNGGSVSADNVQNIDLARRIKEIERESHKLMKEYEQLYREMSMKRAEVKKIANSFEANAKAQDIVGVHTLDASIMRDQLNLITSKAKLIGDKQKSIRDEKKSNKELVAPTAAATTNTGAQVFVNNSPLSVARELNSNTQSNVIKIDAPNLVKPIANSSINTAVSTPSIESKPKVVDPNIELIKSRLENKEELISTPMSLGHDLNYSMDAFIMANTPHKKYIVINTETGEYYERAYEADSSGEYTVLSTRFQPRSVTHLGALDIDAKNKKATTFYEDEPMDYIIDNNRDNMPDFYKDEWDHPKSERFILSEDVLRVIKSYIE